MAPIDAEVLLEMAGPYRVLLNSARDTETDGALIIYWNMVFLS